MTLAPIILFVYNRPEETRKTILALKENYLASQSDLIVFSDGPKSGNEKRVEEVRKLLKLINGFKSFRVHESQSNIGLAASVINGVSQIIKEFGQVIVLEDDIVTTPNFLNFMNDSLQHYSSRKKVYSITGFSSKINVGLNYKYDVYYTGRASSWGWATWEYRWESIDWKVSDYSEFSKSVKLKRQFNKWGSDMSSMLQKQMSGEIDSWAIRWCYHQFKNSLLSVSAIESKVINIGFGDNASNTSGYLRYKSITDQRRSKSFLFSEEIIVDEKIRKQFIKNYSLSKRFKYKLLNLFFK